jgi:hypothetical protein
MANHLSILHPTLHRWVAKAPADYLCSHPWNLDFSSHYYPTENLLGSGLAEVAGRELEAGSKAVQAAGSGLNSQPSPPSRVWVQESSALPLHLLQSHSGCVQANLGVTSSDHRARRLRDMLVEDLSAGREVCLLSCDARCIHLLEHLLQQLLQGQMQCLRLRRCLWAVIQ